MSLLVEGNLDTIVGSSDVTIVSGVGSGSGRVLAMLAAGVGVVMTTVSLAGGVLILETLTSFGLPCSPVRRRGSLLPFGGAGSNVTIWPLASNPRMGLIESNSVLSAMTRVSVGSGVLLVIRVAWLFILNVSSGGWLFWVVLAMWITC